MEALEDRFYKLTGAEYFRFKDWEKLKIIYSPLISTLISKRVFSTQDKSTLYSIKVILNLIVAESEFKKV